MMRELEIVHPQYKIGEDQRRLIVMGALDAGTQKTLTIETNKGNLMTWKELRDFLTGLSINERQDVG